MYNIQRLFAVTLLLKLSMTLKWLFTYAWETKFNSQKLKFSLLIFRHVKWRFFPVANYNKSK